MTDTPPTFLERVRQAGVRSRHWLLPVAFLAFVVTAVLAFLGLPDGLEVNPMLLVVSAVIVCPLSTVANAAEFAATGRALGQPVGASEALRVAVLSSAANLLPVPGAVAVRTHRLRGAAGTRRALGVTAGAGICWLGTALLMAGIADAVVNDRRAGSAIVIAAGIGTLVVAFGLVRQAAGDDAVRRRGWWWIWVCEVAQVVVGAGRLALAVAAIGSPVDLSQALGLAVAPVAGSALGVLPGGLGVREIIAASIAALVAMPAAIGGAAAAVDRLLGLAVVAVLVPFGRKGTKAAASKSPADREELGA